MNSQIAGSRLRLLSVGPAAIALLTAFAAMFEFRDLLSFGQFALSSLLLFSAPGIMLLRLARVDVSALETLTLGTVMGLAGTGLVYCGATALGAPWLVWLWMGAGIVSALSQHTRLTALARAGWSGVEAAHLWLAVILCLVWLPLYWIRYYAPNFTWTADGGMSHVVNGDVLMHVAFANELTHTFPPQVPHLAGLPLSYHIGMDLVAALLGRFSGLPVANLTTHYAPLLFSGLGVLSVFCFGRRFIGSAGAGVAAAALVMLAEDFSFIPGLLQGSQGVWSAQYFKVPSVFSLYYINPMVLGVSFLFCGLLCLLQYMRDREARPAWGWLLCACLCLAVLLQVKIFLFVQLAIAMVLVEAVALIVQRRTLFLIPGLALMVAAAPLAYYTFHGNAGGGNFAWTLSSGFKSYVDPAMNELRMPAVIAYPVAALAIYLIMALGFRVVGLSRLLRALAPTGRDPFAQLLAVFVVVGVVLCLATRIVPADRPNDYDNAVWFIVAAKYGLAIFAVASAAELWPKLGRAARAGCIILAALVALPSTVQSLNRFTGQPLVTWPPSTMQAVTALDAQALPGDVLLADWPNFDNPLLALTKLRSLYTNFAYLPSMASAETIQVRKQDFDAVLRDWTGGVIRADILAKYRVDWILMPSALADKPLLGAASVTADNGLVISRTFANDAFALFKVGHGG